MAGKQDRRILQRGVVFSDHVGFAVRTNTGLSFLEGKKIKRLRGGRGGGRKGGTDPIMYTIAAPSTESLLPR